LNGLHEHEVGKEGGREEREGGREGVCTYLVFGFEGFQRHGHMRNIHEEGGGSVAGKEGEESNVHALAGGDAMEKDEGEGGGGACGREGGRGGNDSEGGGDAVGEDVEEREER